MRYQIKTKILALTTAVSFSVTACSSNDSVQGLKTPSASTAQFGSVSTDNDGEDDQDQALRDASAGSNSDALSRAKTMDDLNQQINRDYAMLSLAEKTKVELEVKLADVKTKKITADSGAVWGQGIAAAGLVALGITAIVLTGGIAAAIIPLAGAVGAGGVAVSSGISNAQTADQVAKITKEITTAQVEVNKKIEELKAKIAQEQAQQSELIKSGAN
ncbi:MAG: hypothetical protein NTY08_11650 [Proteobacteria bacterium]|nr:hypothetical protein [Pseudomonadota bacterium]